jgi:hypothetical protein
MTTTTTSQPLPVQPKERSAWGVWWLCFLPFYYLVWYVKINKELAALTGEKVGTFGLWFGQCVPIVSWIGLAHTSDRINTVRAAKGLPPLPTVGMTILSSLWYGSQTRYLQRRLNTTWLEIGAVVSH